LVTIYLLLSVISIYPSIHYLMIINNYANSGDTVSGDMAVDRFFSPYFQMTIGELTEKLHNCEDKLAAAEKCKELLNEEVKSLKQTLDKLSKDLEVGTRHLVACGNNWHRGDSRK